MIDGDDDDLFGDFEDLETGESHQQASTVNLEENNEGGNSDSDGNGEDDEEKRMKKKMKLKENFNAEYPFLAFFYCFH